MISLSPNPMADSLLRPRPSRVLPFLLASVVGHAAAITLGLLFSWLFGSPMANLDQKPITASLVRLGKPRDDKMLPRKEEEPPPAPVQEKPVEVPSPAPPKVDTAIPIPVKDAKVEPKKDTSKDVSKKDAKKDLFAAFNKTAKPGKAEELEGSADGDVNGDSAKQEGERYYGLLSSVVRRKYDVSNSIAESERRRLHAVVKVRIGAAGQLVDVKLVTSSGNELFDGAVIEAVKTAAPYTPPPAHLREALAKSGVSFDFTP